RVAHLVLELHVLATQRQRRPVDRSERRAQLVRDRRDEILSHRLELALLGQVAEGEHDAVLEADRRERQPYLAAAEVERDALDHGRLAGSRDGDAPVDLVPAGDSPCDLLAEQVALAQAGNAFRGRVPEAYAA